MASSPRLRWALLFALAGGPALSSSARAQSGDASVRMAARELAVAGAEAFDKGDFATALDRFQRAEQLYKAPSIAVMVARCLARVGRVVEAVDKYEETRRSPLDPGAPEAFQRAVQEAATEVEVERGRVARLELRLPADGVAGAQIFLDGKPVPPALIGVATPVDPGTHEVMARAPGKAVYRQDVTLAEGARQSIEVAFSPVAPAAPGPPPTPSRGRSTLGIALLAGGGAALAVGTVAGIVALNDKSSLDKACVPGCPSSMSDELDSFRRNRTLSYLGLGLGLAAVGSGAYFVLHQSSSGSKVGALVLPGGAALAGSF